MKNRIERFLKQLIVVYCRYRDVARQRLGNHIPATANVSNNKTLLLGNGAVNTTRQQ